jgi:rhodanese-related sulfurtransferase
MNELISPQALREQLETGRPPTVVDVRAPETYAAGHLPGAINIPVDELPQRLREVPRDRPVVTY